MCVLWSWWREWFGGYKKSKKELKANVKQEDKTNSPRPRPYHLGSRNDHDPMHPLSLSESPPSIPCTLCIHLYHKPKTHRFGPLDQ